MGTVEAGVGTDDVPAGVEEMESEMNVSIDLEKMEMDPERTLERRHGKIGGD